MLHLVDDGQPTDDADDPNPFVRYGPRLAWWAFARANGMSDGRLHGADAMRSPTGSR